MHRQLSFSAISSQTTSISGQIVLLCGIFSLVQIQYFGLYFLTTVIGGNIFVNAIILGSAESIAGVLSGYLLGRFPDGKVFQALCLQACFFNLLFYAVPEGYMRYFCFFMSTFGIVGQFNSITIVAEMRIPPENLGAAMVIIITVGTVVSASCAFITQLGYPTVMIYPSAMAIISFGLCYWLSEPGKFLPSTASLPEHASLLKLNALEHILGESIHYPAAGYSASFKKTYVEKLLEVERPRLNETNVDPQILKGLQSLANGSGDRSVLDRSSLSKVIKQWAVSSSGGGCDATDAMEGRFQRFYEINDE